MADKKLTRAAVKKIVDGMSARDIFLAAPSQEPGQEPEAIKSNEYAGKVFDIAAARQGYGETALDRVGVGDAMYLSGLLAGALNVGSPKVDSTEVSQPSAATGDSAQN